MLAFVCLHRSLRFLHQTAPSALGKRSTIPKVVCVQTVPGFTETTLVESSGERSGENPSTGHSPEVRERTVRNGVRAPSGARAAVGGDRGGPGRFGRERLRAVRRRGSWPGVGLAPSTAGPAGSPWPVRHGECVVTSSGLDSGWFRRRQPPPCRLQGPRHRSLPRSPRSSGADYTRCSPNRSPPRSVPPERGASLRLPYRRPGKIRKIRWLLSFQCIGRPNGTDCLHHVQVMYIQERPDTRSRWIAPSPSPQSLRRLPNPASSTAPVASRRTGP